MTEQWRNRALATLVASGLVLGGAAVSGDGLDPVAFVVIAFCVASLAWLGADLAGITEGRTDDRPPAPAAGSRRSVDLRTTRLSRRLAEIGRPGYNDEHLWSDLVELIDDRLLRHHDVDRTADPDRAAQVLGPRLTTFVTACPPSRQFARRNYLDAIVTDIEEI
ncbi:MAG: aluminum activated malate transporter family protein [Actinomycetia bacterium]|nr:aluminum activated malate transporter family protein [Actinomycetes bacterium]